MSDSKKKFELPSLQSVVSSVKGIINPERDIPDPEPDDALGEKLQKLALLAKSLEEYQQEFADEMAHQLSEMNGLVNGIYADLKQHVADEQSSEDKEE